MSSAHEKDPQVGELAASGTFRTADRADVDPQTRKLARHLRARILRPKEGCDRTRANPFVAMPDALLVLRDGAVIAIYDGEPLLRYRDLAHLAELQGIEGDDLEALDEVARR